MDKKTPKNRQILVLILLTLTLIALIFIYLQTKKTETVPLKDIMEDPQRFENASLSVEGVVNFPRSSLNLYSCQGCCCPWVIVDPITKTSVCAPEFDKYEGKYIVANVTIRPDKDCKVILELNSILSKKDCINLEFQEYQVPKSEENRIVEGHARRYYCPN